MVRKCSGAERKIRVFHGGGRIWEELDLIVGLGGCVQDITADHKVFGRITADLDICSTQDVDRLIRRVCSGECSPLMTVTSGEHYHRIHADSEKTLDEIENALREAGFLVETLF